MKKYEIRYANTVDTAFLKKLPQKDLERIKKEIVSKLTKSPELFGKPLRKSLKGYRRIRIGSYRVLYKINPPNVNIVFIGQKPDVYKFFEKRI